LARNGFKRASLFNPLPPARMRCTHASSAAFDSCSDTREHDASVLASARVSANMLSPLSLSLSLSLSLCLCLPVPGSPSLSLVPAERYGAPIDHYEQFRETGRPVSKQRPVITSPICRTLVDEATAGYDVKGDIAADLH